MINELRAVPFTPPIDEVLSTRSLDYQDRAISGPEGELAISIFTPRGKPEKGPCIYFIHPGGMIIGDRFTGISDMLDSAEECGAVCISLEYRLAPEHPDPAPVNDCYAGLIWTFEHTAELGIDSRRVIVAGGSAGGGIAAGITLLARDRSGPAILAQLLMSPMLDDRNQTLSSRQYTSTGTWSHESNETGWQALLGDRRATQHVTPYAAPSRATDLQSLPPAFIDVGSAEVFRDEDVDYAKRLWASGVQAELHVWPGGFHQFDVAAPTAALSLHARATRRAWVRRTLDV